MKKYSFTMTKKEISEFSIRFTLEQLRLSIVYWLVLLVLYVAEVIWMWRVGIFLLILGIIFFLALFYGNYRFFKKFFHEKFRTVWLEENMIKVEDETYSEMPCSYIQRIIKTKNLLMLGHYQAKKRIGWIPLPLHIFADKKECDEFIYRIKNARENAGDSKDSINCENNRSELFHFSYVIDEKKWMQILLETTNIMNSGVMGNSRVKVKTATVLLAVLTVLFIPAFFIIWFFNMDVAVLLIAGSIALLSLLMLKHITASPESRIKWMIKRGIMQEDMYGELTVSVTEEGIEFNFPHKAVSTMNWEKFEWIIETDTAFYLFWTDKRHYVMVLKESILNSEQADMFKRLCRDKRLKYAVSGEVRYVKNQVFYVLIFILFAGTFGGITLLAYRDVKADYGERITGDNSAAYGVIEEFNPSDYPDYVPLDEQISVLSSQGFEISPRIAEQARSSMEEYDMMRAYIEGYPYTWLLMELGAPAHNDDWEVTGYSDKVFWFDFEAWDIGTDYITILEGMKALAPHSSVNSVTDIAENTDNVDWDKGTGSIEVSLDWNGEKYTWYMDAYYDWIDGKVLGIFNSLLDKTDEDSRFYVTGDNGQGAIVFYCSDEWADGFEKATGLKMEIGSME